MQLPGQLAVAGQDRGQQWEALKAVWPQDQDCRRGRLEQVEQRRVRAINGGRDLDMTDGFPLACARAFSSRASTVMPEKSTIAINAHDGRVIAALRLWLAEGRHTVADRLDAGERGTADANARITSSKVKMRPPSWSRPGVAGGRGVRQPGSWRP